MRVPEKDTSTKIQMGCQVRLSSTVRLIVSLLRLFLQESVPCKIRNGKIILYLAYAFCSIQKKTYPHPHPHDLYIHTYTL